MNSLCLVARELAHSLCGSACWSCEQNFLSPALQYLNYRVKRCGFSGSGAACQYEHSLGQSGGYRLLLQVGVYYSVAALAHRDRLVDSADLLGGKAQHKLYTRGYVGFGQVHILSKNKVPAADSIKNKGAVKEHIVHAVFNGLHVHRQKARGNIKQLVFWQAGVAVALVMSEHIHDSRAQPHLAVGH